MKKLLLLSGALLLMSVAVASAAQLNIAWTNCVGDAGATDKTFACNTNNGNATAVLSFTPPTGGIPQMSGAEAYVYVATSNGASALPLWWSMFNAGTCRASALTANASIPSSAANCFDAWNAQAGVAGVAAYNMSWNGPGTALIDCAAAVPPSQLQSLDDQSEWFLFNVKIAYTGTVGPTCPGCSTPACLYFAKLDVSEPVGVGDFHMTASGPRTFATWQGGGIGLPGCPAATPTNNKSWGQLKSLYR
ncbi:MAG TPA: hypothetical protein VMH61_08040 [Candidatus Acidoferrales bacterium]|nr:hypothetical protein [Candidatus Acidoferrales bacterium]